MKTNIFLVETPLQLLNAIEARYSFSANKKVLVVFNGINKSGIQQMKNMINKTDWDKIYYITGAPNKLLYVLTQFSRVNKLNKIIKDYRIIENIFIGDYRSGLMRHIANSVSYKHCYLLDDGSATLLLPHYKEKLAFRQLMIEKLLKIFSRYKPNLISNPFLFTVYDKEKFPDNFVKNNGYLYIKNQFNNNVLEDKVFFLGGPLTEKDCVISEDVYFDLLKKIRKYYINYDVFYIPHRRENSEKLKRIEDLTGMKVKKLDTCIEYAICFNKENPKVVASFFSSALINLKYILGEKLLIHGFYLEPEYLTDGYKEHVKQVYSHYSEVIEIISINEK